MPIEAPKSPEFESHPEIVDAFRRLSEKIKSEVKGDHLDLRFQDEKGKTLFVVSEDDSGDFVIEEGERAFYLSHKGFLPTTFPNYDAQQSSEKELKNFDAEWEVSTPQEVVEIVEKMLKLK